MATGTAQLSIPLEGTSGTSTIATDTLLSAMLRAHDQVSDLIFSPGRVPQVEVHGALLAIQAPGLRALTADDTRRIASDLIGSNKQAITALREQGSCDLSYGLPGLARFRVNVFIQRGSCAVVMRVIPTAIPDLASLKLPAQLEEVSSFHDGIVLVTGPRNSGKSSTLAALLDRINRERVCHIITIEDPLEFLHNHKRATVHQRELHSDTPSISFGLRAALRQSPDVILVSELRDRETVEMAMEAAETGHLVLSSLNAADAPQTVERLIALCDAHDHASIRNRLAKAICLVVSQRLLPRKDGSGRVVVTEVLKFNSEVQRCVEEKDFSTQTMLQIMKACHAEGMQDFDSEIAKLVRTGLVDSDTAQRHATDPDQLRQSLAGGC
ncbi:MAG TPA: PilT/PilU family type 4a pilus ATPase [Terriglobales bacterium]|nr:PilT/PilU family type 4a pilus ATPase [Terriglobales bacterium]